MIDLDTVDKTFSPMSSFLSKTRGCNSFYLNLLLSEYESKLLGTVACSCAGRCAALW